MLHRIRNGDILHRIIPIYTYLQTPDIVSSQPHKNKIGSRETSYSELVIRLELTDAHAPVGLYLQSSQTLL